MHLNKEQKKFLFLGLMALDAILFSGFLFELGSVQTIINTAVHTLTVTSLVGGISATAIIGKWIGLGMTLLLLVGLCAFILDSRGIAIFLQASFFYNICIYGHDNVYNLK